MIFDLREATDVHACRNAGYVCLQMVIRPPFNRIDAVVKLLMIPCGQRTLYLHVIYKSGCYQLIRLIRQSQDRQPGVHPTSQGGTGLIGDMATQLWQTIRNTKSEFVDDPSDTDLVLWQKSGCCSICTGLTVIDGLTSSAYGVTKAVVDVWATREDDSIILRDRSGWLYSIRPNTATDLVPKPLGVINESLVGSWYDGKVLKWCSGAEMVFVRFLTGMTQKRVNLSKMGLPEYSIHVTDSELSSVEETPLRKQCAPGQNVFEGIEWKAIELCPNTYISYTNHLLVLFSITSTGLPSAKLTIEIETEIAQVLSLNRSTCCLLHLENGIDYLLDFRDDLHEGCMIEMHKLPESAGNCTQVVDSSSRTSDLADLVVLRGYGHVVKVNVFNGWSQVLESAVNLLLEFHPPSLADTYRTTRWLLMCARHHVPTFGRICRLKHLASVMILNIWIQHLETICNGIDDSDLSSYTVVYALETVPPIIIDDPDLFAIILQDDEEPADDDEKSSYTNSTAQFLTRLVAFTSILVDLICYTDNAPILAEILSSRLVNRGLLVQSIFALEVESRILLVAHEVFESAPAHTPLGSNSLDVKRHLDLVLRLIRFIPNSLVQTYFNLTNELLRIKPELECPSTPPPRRPLDQAVQPVDSACIDNAELVGSFTDPSPCLLCRFRIQQQAHPAFENIIYKGQATCPICLRRCCLVFNVLARFEKFQAIIQYALPPHWPVNFLHPLTSQKFNVDQILLWTDLSLTLKDGFISAGEVATRSIDVTAKSMGSIAVDPATHQFPQPALSLLDDDLSLVPSPEQPITKPKMGGLVAAESIEESSALRTNFIPGVGGRHAEFWLRVCRLERHMDDPSVDASEYTLPRGNHTHIPVAPLVLFGIIERSILNLHCEADLIDLESCLTRNSGELMCDLILISPILLLQCVVLPLLQVARRHEYPAERFVNILNWVCECLERVLGWFGDGRWCEMCIVQLIRFCVLASMIADELYTPEDETEVRGLIQMMLSSREDLINDVRLEVQDEIHLVHDLMDHWQSCVAPQVYEKALLMLLSSAKACTVWFSAQSVDKAYALGYRKAAIEIAKSLSLYTCAFSLMSHDEIYAYVSAFPSNWCCCPSCEEELDCCQKSINYKKMRLAYWKWCEGKIKELRYLGLAIRLILDHDSHDTVRLCDLSLDLFDHLTRRGTCADFRLVLTLFLWRSFENPEVNEALAKSHLRDTTALEYSETVHNKVSNPACLSIALGNDEAHHRFVWRIAAAHVLRHRIASLLMGPDSALATSVVGSWPIPSSTGASPIMSKRQLESSMSYSHLPDDLEERTPAIHDHFLSPALFLAMVSLSNSLLRVPLSAFDREQLPAGSIHAVLLDLFLAQRRGDIEYVAEFLSNCVPNIYSQPLLKDAHTIGHTDLWPNYNHQEGSFIIAVLSDMPEACLSTLIALHKKYGTTQSWFSKIYEQIENVAGCRLKIPYTPETSSTALRKAMIDLKLASCQVRLTGDWVWDQDKTTDCEESSALFISSSTIRHGFCAACAETLQIDGHSLTAKSLGEYKWLEVKRSLNMLEIDSSGNGWHRDCHGIDFRWVTRV